jgi:N-methylhydantoinase A
VTERHEDRRVTVRYQIGCDLGGTFTDVAAIDSDGRVHTDKADTTLDNLADGLLRALENLAERVGRDLPELLRDTERFVNGTTVVTNSIAELRGAKTGLVTTLGFGDNMLIARSARNAHRDLHKQLNIPQVVPRDLVVEVPERIDRKGRVVVPLDEADARRAIDQLVERGVEAVAVSLLWSFLNPEHERLIADIVERDYPHLFLSVSHRLHPVMREYERTMTTVLNAFTGLRVAEYTGKIEAELSQRGLAVPVSFMQGFGGTISAEDARSQPITLVDSGPAGGVIGSQALAARLGLSDVVTADMGGTSFDVAVLHRNKPLVTQRVMLREQFLTALTKIDVLPIGAGGGSIARLDARGVPQVGPESAGAHPGPICYGQGGDRPTVTDATAVLGLLDPKTFLGGRRELHVEPASEALAEVIGAPLGVGAREAAAAVYRLVTANMSNAVRSVTVERGHDPRGFAMIAYGGAVGIFAADIADAIGIGRVILPANAAVFSAHGLLASDEVRTQAKSAMWLGGDAGHVLESLVELERTQVEALRAAGCSDDAIDVEWQGEFKFVGQQWEIVMEIPRKHDLGTDDLVELQRAFPSHYEREYGKGSAWEGSPVLLMSVRVVATGRVAALAPKPAQSGRTQSSITPTGRRTVFLPTEGRQAEVSVYDAAHLVAGAEFSGPAILEHPLTTVQVPNGWTLEVDEWGNYLLRRRPRVDDRPDTEESMS